MIFAEDKRVLFEDIKSRDLSFFLLLWAILKGDDEREEVDCYQNIGRERTKCTETCLEGITATIVHTDCMTKDVKIDKEALELWCFCHSLSYLNLINY